MILLLLRSNSIHHIVQLPHTFGANRIDVWLRKLQACRVGISVLIEYLILSLGLTLFFYLDKKAIMHDEEPNRLRDRAMKGFLTI